jgi:seryl-tRNA synthetase
MLTIKLITEETDRVIRGLEKKNFKGAAECIAKVIELNDKRRSAQNQLDKNLAEVNATSKTIGMLMKEGKKEEAEVAKQRVAESKRLINLSKLQWIKQQKICRICFIPFRIFLMMKFLKV